MNISENQEFLEVEQDTESGMENAALNLHCIWRRVKSGGRLRRARV